MVNKDRVKEWIAALRSDDYPQTTACLRDDKGYCCLGVAAQVAINNGHGSWSDKKDGLRSLYVSPTMPGFGENHEAFVLTDDLRDWYGLTEDDLEVSLGPRRIIDARNLTELNDELRMSFEEIADVLEDKFLTSKI